MILYTLQCAAGHRFDSWFPSSASYESQRARQLVSCPVCTSTQVEKAVMAPSVARTDLARTDLARADPARDAAEPPPADAEGKPALPMLSQPEAELRSLMRKLREHVVKTSDYVGDEFADLARKMHDGEVEHRSIYGEATPDEVEALREDEVEVFPLPILPDDRN
ncbi:DUF1178 family protein [Xanthobacter agilis]|uniref:DUF1178 family protein n=1 Tax=Xanthobacter agilis TaxID=47492 RepID=A0ABU0L827_XANAG|nr:DUF1178 family protein [Xanthobacter agilis]MDQ0503303.1 hypothetical protein [Xanthobacter agilis]